MSPQIGIVCVESLQTVSITEVTEVVLLSEMLEQLLVVKEARFTELTERMTLHGGVVRVTFPSVLHQLLPGVGLPLVTVQFEVGDTQLAVVELVLPPQMFVQQLEGLEDLSTHRTLVEQQLRVHVLDLLSLKTNLVLPVHRVDVILDLLKLD